MKHGPRLLACVPLHDDARVSRRYSRTVHGCGIIRRFVFGQLSTQRASCSSRRAARGAWPPRGRYARAVSPRLRARRKRHRLQRLAAMSALEAIRYRRGSLELLDQRLLPLQVIYVRITNAEAAHAAIKDMVVRGAPAIAIAAALAVALELAADGAAAKFADGAAAAGVRLPHGRALLPPRSRAPAARPCASAAAQPRACAAAPRRCSVRVAQRLKWRPPRAQPLCTRGWTIWSPGAAPAASATPARAPAPG
jgi:hypothetical protein